MLVDKVKIKIESGLGGRGSTAMFNNQPVGGNGGEGGSLYFRGSMNLYDLGKFKPFSKHKADDGEDGQHQKRKGSNASDMFIDVPLVTTITFENGEKIVISEHAQVVKALDGGLGAYGNLFLKKNKDLPLSEYRDRRNNRSESVELTLNLKSDVIFLGYPNAGKSSLLNLLSNAQAKTAPYAFTTIDPQIGLMNGIRLMDLPGLIDGSYEGKGVGTKFLKHTVYSKLVLHCISLEEQDPLAVYNSLRVEIAKIDDSLASKPEIVVLTKTDLREPDEVKKIEQQFVDAGKKVFSCSIIDDEAVERLVNSISEMIIEVGSDK